jgi:hypothetical protein
MFVLLACTLLSCGCGQAKSQEQTARLRLQILLPTSPIPGVGAALPNTLSRAVNLLLCFSTKNKKNLTF